jgi:hypothetical protein
MPNINANATPACCSANADHHAPASPTANRNADAATVASTADMTTNSTSTTPRN